MLDPVDFLQSLVKCKSITPESGGSIELMQKTLEQMGFFTEIIEFQEDGTYPVKNLYAKIGEGDLTLAFCGHLDVVPEGDSSMWSSDPFLGNIIDGKMIGRGVEDMKGGIACFTAAISEVISNFDHKRGSIVFLITLDEEQIAINGIKKLVKYVVEEKKQNITSCLLGEPTCINTVGDNIKIGRRGSLNFVITVNGKQGHVAYPQFAKNPVPLGLKIAERLTQLKLSDANQDFEASNLEITNIETSSKKFNLIPAFIEIKGNIRFNNNHNLADLKIKIESLLEDYKDIAKANFMSDASESFKVSNNSKIYKDLKNAIIKVTKKEPLSDANGGTSDARFLKDYTEVVEFGLVEKTLHQVDESAKVEDIVNLKNIYAEFIKNFFE